MNRAALLHTVFAIAVAAVAAVAAVPASADSAVATPAERLADTGLYADFATRRIAPGILSFTPQYPLWSDGATKRRWLRLPHGSTIDASDPDAWVFPVGTKLWKEFSFARRVETRTLELTESGWIYATYRWLPDESDAILAPRLGVRGAYEIAPGQAYDLPGRGDCRACHEGNVSRVLGFSALQLSSDRDPGAIHGEPLRPGDIDLTELVARGLVVGLPPSLVASPPRIPAASPNERAALGYLHGNCASCHNDRGALAELDFALEVRLGGGAPGARALATAVARVARFQPAGSPATFRLAAGHPESSLALQRMARRDPISQMPPLGSRVVDREAVERLKAWIQDDLGAPRVASHPRSEEGS